MLLVKLAFRNLISSGLRACLSIGVLSLIFVTILWLSGFVEGWNQQALSNMTDWEVGDGQFWQKNYDPYDIFSLAKSHAKIPVNFSTEALKENLAPILITQATIYPQGRMQNILIKGINPGQKVLKLPTLCLSANIHEIPVLMGTRMSQETNLKINDTFTIRWRNANGAFDAADARVMDIMKTKVPTVDSGQLWLPLERLQKMMQLPGQSTIIVVNKRFKNRFSDANWLFRNHEYLTEDHRRMVKLEKTSDNFFYAILLSLSLLAIFDTQTLAIFRRRKEIGTLIALGMTKNAVIKLFTIEGFLHGLFAVVAAGIYGTPILAYTAHIGIGMPEAIEGFGMGITERIFPVFTLELLVSSTIFVLLSVTIVSYIPARKIAQLNPTDAIRGKLS